jgi:hypothetical protein
MVMWLLTLFPTGLETWLVHIILAIGIISLIVGSLADKIPGISQYTAILKIVGAICIVSGIYFEGAASVDEKYKNQLSAMQKRVDELQKEVIIANAQSTSINTTIADTIQKQIASVKVTQTSIQSHIDQVAKKIDSQCVIDPEAIAILNSAAGSKK